jgi:IS5 family transposase
LDPDNRWLLFHLLMPLEEMEDTYAPQFSSTTGAPANSVRMAFGALFIKQRLGLSDEEIVEQIRENPYMQFFLALLAIPVKRRRSVNDGSFSKAILGGRPGQGQ